MREWTRMIQYKGMEPQKANTRMGLCGKLKNTDMHEFTRMIQYKGMEPQKWGNKSMYSVIPLSTLEPIRVYSCIFVFLILLFNIRVPHSTQKSWHPVQS